MSAPQLRRIEATDLDALAALHARCFPEDPWDRRALAGILAMPGAGGWLAVEAAAPAGPALGFLLARRAAEEAEVLSLGVEPALRRRGLGRALLDAACALLGAEGVAELFLEVALDNRAARRLYAGSGFAEVGRRAGYLKGPQGPRDALILRRRLGR